jgi:hypothetical protein
VFDNRNGWLAVGLDLPAARGEAPRGPSLRSTNVRIYP